MVIGRVGNFRGRDGELTVRVASGAADRWTGLRRVGLRFPVESGDEARFEVESARAYGDRLVLKLRGVDNATAAADLRGRFVVAPSEDVPELPRGTHYAARLVGLPVEDALTGPVGRIVDVLATGGADVLVVEAQDGSEVLIPFAKEITVRVDAERVVVRMPEGLLDLNRGQGEPS